MGGVESLPPVTTLPLKTRYPDAGSLFADAFTDRNFQFIVMMGLIIFYALQKIGCYVYDNFVPLNQRKMQKEQFAGIVISMVHAFMIAVASTLVTLNYTAFDAFRGKNDEMPFILSYKICATLSVSYFILDAFFICYYYNDPLSKKISFFLHHFLSGMCMCSVLLAKDAILSYISALNFLIEWSTVILNLRMFARIWSMKRLYFVSGIGVLTTYPLTRVVWNCYLVFISFTSPYLPMISCPEAPYVLGGAEIFVALLSCYYYFAFILRKPSAIYTLKQADIKPDDKKC